jgi:hypothetical protein
MMKVARADRADEALEATEAGSACRAPKVLAHKSFNHQLRLCQRETLS